MNDRQTHETGQNSEGHREPGKRGDIRTEPPDISVSREIDPRKELVGGSSDNEHSHLPKGRQRF